MVDSMDIYKSLNSSTATVMKNPEMLRFFLDYLKTKKYVSFLINIRLNKCVIMPFSKMMEH